MSQKRKAALLGVLMALAVLVFYFDAKGPSLPNSISLIEKQKYIPLAVENPELQRWKLTASHKTEYKSSGRDLFSESLPPAPRPTPPIPQPDPGPPVPVEPPPPTLPGNVKFFGYGTVPNGTAKRAFLSDGEEVYIVGEGDTFLGRFRIIRIGNASLEFEETATGRRNSATLDEQGAPPA
jgi:hypothetical protein